MDTRPRTSLISFCTVQLRTLCVAHSLATLCLYTTSGPDPGELPGFWGSMAFRHAPIPRKGSGNQQQQQDIGPAVLQVVTVMMAKFRKSLFHSFQKISLLITLLLSLVQKACQLVEIATCRIVRKFSNSKFRVTS